MASARARSPGVASAGGFAVVPVRASVGFGFVVALILLAVDSSVDVEFEFAAGIPRPMRARPPRCQLSDSEDIAEEEDSPPPSTSTTTTLSAAAAAGTEAEADDGCGGGESVVWVMDDTSDHAPPPLPMLPTGLPSPPPVIEHTRPGRDDLRDRDRERDSDPPPFSAETGTSPPRARAAAAATAVPAASVVGVTVLLGGRGVSVSSAMEKAGTPPSAGSTPEMSLPTAATAPPGARGWSMLL